MKFFTFVFIALFTFSLNSYSDTVSDSDNKEQPQLLLLANVQINKNIEGLSLKKVESALNLAAGLSGKYMLIPNTVRDSIVDHFMKNKKQPTADDIANELGAGKVVFINLNVLEKIIRVAYTAVDLKNKSKAEGTGYAYVAYSLKETGQLIYDPALLEALQRAMAVADKDTNMFAGSKFPVYPAQTLVVGGIEFQHDPELQKWDLFHDKTVNSYAGVETIISKARNNERYVVYDIGSRDSVYALFNLRLVENCFAPNNLEIKALFNLEVDRFITGTLKRVNSGAILDLALCSITKDGLVIIKKEMDILSKDSIREYEKVVARLTEKLLKNEDEIKNIEITE